MGPVFCPRCQRANPPDGLYCYFDGHGLRNGVDGQIVTNAALGREFVFPSGRRCRTFDELVQACSLEWASARSMLQKGSLRQYLASIGRMDLAHQADRAAAHVDPDLGLDQLLAVFPMKEGGGPRLDLAPRRLHLGNIKAGDSRDLMLQILNRGSRLLHGTVEVRGDDWLRVGADGGGNGQANGRVPVKTGQLQDCPLHIETHGLPAGQQYAATLAVVTNGGTAEVPITFDLSPIPFPHAPLAGAVTPRDLAARMKELPKQAAPLLERGEIERWFTVNGWRYPVQGPTAPGVAGVQQFFEGMGLSKPPPLSVTPPQLEVECRPGGTVRTELQLNTSAKKWVYAFFESDVPWITPLTPNIAGGQSATAALQVSARGLTPASRHQGTLNLIANGGQRIPVKVTLNVTVAQNHSQRFLQPIAAGVLGGLLLRTLLLVPDLAARNWQSVQPENYVQKFSVLTFWIVILALWFVLRRKGKLRDFVAAFFVGGLGGLVLACTVGQVLPFLDRLIPLGNWPGAEVLSWGILGGGLGLIVSMLGQTGRQVINRIGDRFARAARARACGLLLNFWRREQDFAPDGE